jgi:hypothetical protein
MSDILRMQLAVGLQRAWGGLRVESLVVVRVVLLLLVNRR